jgi:hypothetical protein
MENKSKGLISLCTWTAIIALVLRILASIFLDFLKCEHIYDWIGAVSEAVSFSLVVATVYNKWAWKINFLDKTPRIYGQYSGTIYYNYNGQQKKKSTKVEIKQTYLKVRVKIKTNEITSNTITSDMVEENGEYILYYTYITNPQSQYSDENPIQYGTCRLMLSEKNKLIGQYWTSRKTKGDIKLSRRRKNTS